MWSNNDGMEPDWKPTPNHPFIDFMNGKKYEYLTAKHAEYFNTVHVTNWAEEYVRATEVEYNRLKAENARLREALEFYAQKPEPDITSIFAKSAEEWGVGSATWEPLLDLGEKAREALNSKNNT